MTREEAINVLNTNSLNEQVSEAIQVLIPELVKNEENKIKNWIIDAIDFYNNLIGDPIMHIKALAWINKKDLIQQSWPNLSNCKHDCKTCLAKCFYRKEPYQKPVELNHKFEVGDIITSSENNSLKYQIKEVGVRNELNEYDYIVEDVTDDPEYRGKIHEMSIKLVDKWGVLIPQKIEEREV